jgi:hypothetical protein
MCESTPTATMPISQNIGNLFHYQLTRAVRNELQSGSDGI